ncbi:hypothetical protein PR048_013807 [Dryococelus australis]|uniref:C2 domain-containing protein n=1 Tax=Dryococelus australis TaxID=614101 RepID=A0ABQ9HU14_9NEOP|nr:hypothetical protein PR048_013807 [Dryococelus australis]
MQGRLETADHRENPPISAIVRYDSHMRKSGGDPAWNRTQFVLVFPKDRSEGRHWTALDIEFLRADEGQASIACLTRGATWKRREQEASARPLSTQPAHAVEKGMGRGCEGWKNEISSGGGRGEKRKLGERKYW